MSKLLDGKFKCFKIKDNVQIKMSSKCHKRSIIDDGQFNKLLLEVTDSTLTNILGVEAKRELYVYFKAVLSLNIENVSRELEAFHTGLKLLFGSGAISIENAIVNDLYPKINLKVSAEDNFVNLVKKARVHFTLGGR